MNMYIHTIARCSGASERDKYPLLHHPVRGEPILVGRREGRRGRAPTTMWVIEFDDTILRDVRI